MDSDERDRTVKETDDLASINWERYFVRAVLPLAVEGRGRPYRIGAWVEVEEKIFERIRALWSEAEQAQEPPFPAKLANDIPPFNACGLEVKLQLAGPTTRPSIVVPPSEHPLHYEQCHGISEHRAAEYSGYFIE